VRPRDAGQDRRNAFSAMVWHRAFRSERSRLGIGSLLLGYYDQGALRFAGKVATGKGWTDAFGRAMRRQLEGIEVKVTPFTPAPPRSLSKNAHRVEPVLVAEVQFTEWTHEGVSACIERSIDPRGQ
jgi:ATP-dependent DNA ligase